MTERLLITGGGGFIGTNLIHELTESRGYQISVIDNESTAAPGSLDAMHTNGVRVVRGDIRDLDVLRRALDGVDTVVHLAADTRVLDSIADPVKNFEVNAVGTFHLLRLARQAGVKRVVNASTGGAILGDAPAPVHEDMPARPLSPYGASKLAAEGYCSAFSGAYGLSTTSLRFSNVYGPHSGKKGSVVAHYLKQLLKGEELVVFGDGSQVRDFLFVRDLARGVRQALEARVCGVFQLGSGRPTTLNELVAAIRDTVGASVNVRVRHADFRPGEVRVTWCDISKARGAFGFSPDTSLKEGLLATWEWFLSHERV